MRMHMTDQAEGDVFAFRLSLLVKELEHSNTIISNFDSFTQASKNWAITLWAGSLALVLSNEARDLRAFVFLTPVIPIVFWFLDAHWRRMQRRTIYRNVRISE